MKISLDRLKKALGFGAIAGMRAMAAPMFISHYFRYHRNQHIAHSKLACLQQSNVAKGLKVATAFEMMNDKLPFVPDRTGAIPLIGRMGSGAIAGATIYHAEEDNPVLGAAIAGLAAIGAAFAVMHLRKAIVKHTFLPDAVVALAEDVAVVALGKKLLKRGL